MIAALLVILAATLLGIPVAGKRLGLAFVIGLAACTLILMIPIPWSRTWLAIAYLVLLAVGWTMRRPRFERPRKPDAIVLVLLVVGAIELTGYILLATVAPLWEFDFLSDWGLKGRVFALAHGIDWTFLQHATYRATHADYPPMIPLAFDLVAIVNGAWDDRAIGLLYPAFAVAGALIAYGAAREEVGERWAALIAVILLPLCATPWIGLADGPFAIAVLGAIVLIRKDEVALGAVLAGCAALMKNEGFALIVALAIAMAFAKKKPWRLWPAVALALPWIVLKRLHGIEGDIGQGSLLTRVFERLQAPGEIVRLLGTYAPHRWLLWVGLALALVLVGKRERFAVTTLALQLAAYIAVYFATPHDVTWHIRWSWERLVTHVWPALAFVLLVALTKDRNVGPALSRPQ
ncbi:MAG: hypothetical protein JOZ54_08315 [Acidobacteria bacterium]|nr:hypothetical protein [Acidobacteriota bacterium]